MNQCLRDLGLNDTNLSGDGVDDIIDSIQGNLFIRSVSIGKNNKVEEHQFTELRKCLNQTKRVREQLFNEALSDFKVPWNRGKLVLVGASQAGKTATLRSLLGNVFDPEWRTTIGIDTKIAKSVENNKWEESQNHEMTNESVNKQAAWRFQKLLNGELSADELTDIPPRIAATIDRNKRKSKRNKVKPVSVKKSKTYKPFSPVAIPTNAPVHKTLGVNEDSVLAFAREENVFVDGK